MKRGLDSSSHADMQRANLFVHDSDEARTDAINLFNYRHLAIIVANALDFVICYYRDPAQSGANAFRRCYDSDAASSVRSS
jgi:hypothetical protein